MAKETISQDLADNLATKNFDVTYFDAKGSKGVPAADARTFSFDWTGPSGKNYGTAVFVLGDQQNLMRPHRLGELLQFGHRAEGRLEPSLGLQRSRAGHMTDSSGLGHCLCPTTRAFAVPSAQYS